MTAVETKTEAAIIVNRGPVLVMLNALASAISPRTFRPVLACVKLTIGNDMLTMAATDLECCTRISTSLAQVEMPGEVLIPLDRLRMIFAKSADETMRIRVQGDRAIITGSDSEFKVNTMPVADFPPVPDVEGECQFEIIAGDLARLLAQTKFAVAKESTRYAFNGILCEADKSLTFVATESHVLAIATAPLLAPRKKRISAIIPRKAVEMIQKLIDDPEEMVGFQVKDNSIGVRFNSASLTSNLIEGVFPPYDDVIPKETDKSLTAGTADFRQACERVSLMAEDAIAPSHAIRLSFSKMGVKLRTNDPVNGEAEVNFACKYQGADMDYGLNPKFLIPALRACDTDEITLEMTAPNRPCLIKSGPMFQCVLMPVNIQ